MIDAHDPLSELKEFVDASPGWSFEMSGPSYHSFAARTFDLGDFRYRLWLAQAVSGRGKWCATCRDKSDDTVAEVFDDAESVKAWIRRFERAIRLIGVLAQCRNSDAVYALVKDMTATDIKTIEDIFDHRRSGSWTTAVSRIVSRVCGFRVEIDQWRLRNV